MRSPAHTPVPCGALSTTQARLRPGSRPLLLLSTLLVLGGGQALAQGGWGGPDSQRREAFLRQQAEAMARLGGRERRDYFEARRDLERRHSAQRLDQLSQLERCVDRARGRAAVERCQRNLQDQRMAERRQEMGDLADLQRRFGLPSWGAGRGGYGAPSPTRDGVSPYGPRSYGQPYGLPYGQPYGAQPNGANWLGDLLQSLMF